MSIASEVLAREETVISIPLSELHPFPDHPFKVRDDEAMQGMMESVRVYGVLTPAIVRPREDGGYEIIAGHRRKRASEVAGLEALPAIVRDMDNDAATILMVDSNIQRENVLPMERAFAYKMKIEATNRQGMRTDRTSPKISAKFRSDDEIGAELGVSGDTIRNLISLTQLIPELQQMVDDKRISLSPAYQIVALNAEEQSILAEALNEKQVSLSLAQAKQLKKLSQSDKLDAETLHFTLTGEQKPKQVPPKVSPPSSCGQQEPQKENHPRHQPASRAAPQAPVASKAPVSSSGTGNTPPKNKPRGFADDIAQLKDTTKECRCTPEVFLSTFTEYVNRSSREIEVFTIPFYERVFPALSPEHMSDLRRQIDAIHAAADKFYEKVKGKNQHEYEK